MSNLNKVLLIGNLTRNPEVKEITTTGNTVCNFGLAINRKWKGTDGKQKEEVCFIEVNMFGKRGEAINTYFKKGDAIFIQGRLQFNSWNGATGEKRSMLRVIAEDFQFIGGKKEETPKVIDLDQPMQKKVKKAKKAKKVA